LTSSDRGSIYGPQKVVTRITRHRPTPFVGSTKAVKTPQPPKVPILLVGVLCMCHAIVRWGN